MSVKDASELLGVNQHTAKTIMYTLKKEGRINKKKHRTKKAKQLQNNPFAIQTTLPIINERMGSKEMVSARSEIKNEEHGGFKFSFQIYKQNIELEYNQHLTMKRMEEEEKKRKKCLMLPFIF